MSAPAPAAAARALSFGQPSRGATSRKSVRPKLTMARAAKPIFSPSCGLTRMTDGIAPLARPPEASLAVPFRAADFAGRFALSDLAFMGNDDAIEDGWLAMGPSPAPASLPTPEICAREQDQGEKPGRRPRRGRDDAGHLGDDQGKTDLPLSRSAAPLFRPQHRQSRPDPRPGHHRARERE